MRSGRVTKIPPPSPPLPKGEGIRDIGHSITIANLFLGINSVTVSYFIHCDSLLQNASDIITKCDSYFITKFDRSLLQNTSGFYYKTRQFDYKMRLLLQNATILLQNAKVITKWNVYYKLRQYRVESKFLSCL